MTLETVGIEVDEKQFFVFDLAEEIYGVDRASPGNYPHSRNNQRAPDAQFRGGCDQSAG